MFFFLPYVTLYGESFTTINILEFMNENSNVFRIDAIIEVIFVFIVPVVLTAISAILMIFKVSVPRCVITSVLNVLAVGVYFLLFNTSFIDVNSENIGFGLVCNIVVACLGVILPIVIIVLHKAAAKNSIQEEVA